MSSAATRYIQIQLPDASKSCRYKERTQYRIISELNVVGDTDLRDAGVRHDRDGAGEETKIPSRPDAPADCSDCLCR